MKKNIIIILIVVLAAIAIRFVFSKYDDIMQGIMRRKGSTPSVTVGEIQEANVIKQLEAPGRIVSKYRVDILARIEGYLTKSYFKEGDYVKKGQTLFQIEPQEYLYDVQKAKANAANTRAQLIYAEKQLKRAAILVKKDYIAKAEYDEMLSNADALKGQLAMYQAGLRDAQRNYSYTRVKAPVDGQVGMINVTVGNYVNASAGTLTTIYSTNPIYVTFPIDSKEYMNFSKIDSSDAKRKVDLVFPTGEKYEISGVQDFHDNSVDESTGTITMRATFPNPEKKLLNGEYVKIKMYSALTVNVPIVPQIAVMENPQGQYVYLIKKDNIPEMQFIKTSGTYKDNWIIQSGLKKGDKIIISGLQKVVPDQKVIIKN
jgi:membrane fusion protein, multidrug efflux system